VCAIGPNDLDIVATVRPGDKGVGRHASSMTCGHPDVPTPDEGWLTLNCMARRLWTAAGLDGRSGAVHWDDHTPSRSAVFRA
jgi:hypothetical protein